MSANNEDRIRDYDRIAKLFDHRLGFYTRQTIDEAVRIARLTGNERILDACCGTGELLQLLGLAGHRGQITGIDFSDTMLNVAARRLAPYKNIEIKRGHVTHVDIAANEVDVIFNTNAFHYLNDPNAVLREFERVLKPHGRLIMVDLAATTQLTRLWLGLRRLFRPSYHRVYRSEELAKLLTDNKFTIVRRKQWRINLLWSVMLFEVQKPAPHKR